MEADEFWPLVISGIIVAVLVVWFLILAIRPSTASWPVRGDSWSDHRNGQLSSAALGRRRTAGVVGLIVVVITVLIFWSVMAA